MKAAGIDSSILHHKDLELYQASMMKTSLLLILTMAVATTAFMKCDISFKDGESSRPCWGRYSMRFASRRTTYCCSNRKMPSTHIYMFKVYCVCY
ncbi:hypothetical protein RRG08_066068 [Elysia crispata]|uniref:Uncharacterized protein n=1 Tax=Elysia crispata TaxID=231223 RepID=A0AAE1B8N5_9GAST|nr:hypothetical protein RRG08_066068 [Elysia crispata]